MCKRIQAVGEGGASQWGADFNWVTIWECPFCLDLLGKSMDGTFSKGFEGPEPTFLFGGAHIFLGQS